jgi:hypothetical protein
MQKFLAIIYFQNIVCVSFQWVLLMENLCLERLFFPHPSDHLIIVN